MEVAEIWRYPVKTMGGEIAVGDPVELLRGTATAGAPG
jgi:uncharacterized protein YcbX